MADAWSANIVGQMHMKRITGRKLAKITGYTEQYISMILNGHRDTEQSREKIEQAVGDYKGGRMNDLPVIAYAPPICKRCDIWIDGVGCGVLFNAHTNALGAYPLDLKKDGRCCDFFEMIREDTK